MNTPLKLLDIGVRTGSVQYWANPSRTATPEAFEQSPTAGIAAEQALKDWSRFSPLLSRLFPELADHSGRIVSPLCEFPSSLGKPSGVDTLLIKADHQLPVTGTIKSRGGVFEVLCHAEKLARNAGLLRDGGSSEVLAEPDAKALFAQHQVVTGSTGNLGYSVGLTAKALGFAVQIHMSVDAKSWKADRLRALGVDVIQHPGDFSSTVTLARAAAQGCPDAHFVDDEDSLTLFLGYSAAAFEIRDQLHQEGITIGSERPLIVYLPCGVGGSPGGITFGLKHLFGDDVHCVFVEPTAAPAFMLQVASGSECPVSVYDYGLDNKTIADGLAVSSPSQLVYQHVGTMVEGFATVDDDSLLVWTRRLWEAGHLRLEPSAAAGFEALRLTALSPDRPAKFDKAVHVVWTTGGAQLPDAEFERILDLASSVDCPAVMTAAETRIGRDESESGKAS